MMLSRNDVIMPHGKSHSSRSVATLIPMSVGGISAGNKLELLRGRRALVPAQDDMM